MAVEGVASAVAGLLGLLGKLSETIVYLANVINRLSLGAVLARI